MRPSNLSFKFASFGRWTSQKRGASYLHNRTTGATQPHNRGQVLQYSYAALQDVTRLSGRRKKARPAPATLLPRRLWKSAVVNELERVQYLFARYPRPERMD